MAATKPLTTESIALTEKKMDMTLEDIIKMSKKSTTSKIKPHRISNKSQKPANGAPAQGNTLKMRRFMDSRSSMRQGALAQRRSNFQGNQFPLGTEVARKAALAPIRNRPINRNRMVNWNKPRIGAPQVQRRIDAGFPVRQQQQQQLRQQVRVAPNRRPQTLDSLFANMKEQRMRVQTNNNGHTYHNGARFQQNDSRRVGGVQPRRQWGRGRFGNFGN